MKNLLFALLLLFTVAAAPLRAQDSELTETVRKVGGTKYLVRTTETLIALPDSALLVRMIADADTAIAAHTARKAMLTDLLSDYGSLAFVGGKPDTKAPTLLQPQVEFLPGGVVSYGGNSVYYNALKKVWVPYIPPAPLKPKKGKKN